MTSPLNLLWQQYKRYILALGGVVLVIVGAGLVVRCRPKPSEQTVSVQSTDHSKVYSAENTKQKDTTTTKKNVKRVKEVYRPDGSLASRTTTEDGSTSVKNSETEGEKKQTSEHDSSTKTEVKTIYKKPHMALTGGAEWYGLSLTDLKNLNLKPSGYRLGLDVPLGEVLTLPVNVGAEAHFPRNSFNPDGVSLTVRVELPW